MGISVKADTPFPNASMALAQFFTNARSMTAFAKIVSIYPSTIASYDDPFFSSTATAIEDSGRATAKDVVSKYADIVPTIPAQADVNDIVLKAVESAIFNGVDPQKALSDAVVAADKLIK
jgi:ABC-type glycerol-3-phosphate transport system substrate-binding protein